MKLLKDILGLLAILLFIAFLFWWQTKRPKEIIKIQEYFDTIVIRDTVFYLDPVPVKQYITRIDTVYLPSVGTTDTLQVEVPIERKEYETDDYRAVIEGYRPELVSMTLFPQTKTIYHTQIQTIKKKPHWGIGIQVGGGFTGTEIKPYIGIGIQYNFLTF